MRNQKGYIGLIVLLAALVIISLIFLVIRNYVFLPRNLPSGSPNNLDLDKNSAPYQDALDRAEEIKEEAEERDREIEEQMKEFEDF